MRAVRFCIQSDPRYLLQKYLLRAKEIGQPEKLVFLKFLLGIDIPGQSHAARMAEYVDKAVQARFDIQCRKFRAAQVCAFLAQEFKAPRRTSNMIEIIKVPTFGTQPKSYLPKAPGYCPFMPQRHALTPADMIRNITSARQVAPVGSAEAFRQKRLEDNVSWLRTFYNAE